VRDAWALYHRSVEILVAGAGRLGLQLAAAVAGAGGTVRGVLSRNPSARHHPGAGGPVLGWEAAPGVLDTPLIVLAVPDDAIPATARRLASFGPLDGRTVLHTSGLHTSDALAACREAGAAVGSWHPLGTFPPLELGRARWRGLWTAVEGDPAAVEAARALSRRLGCRPWRIDPARKARYHAAAAVAANLTHVLAATAVREAAAAGLPHPGEALAPLVLASCRAALDHPGMEALTGPLARGDAGTIRRHLESLPPPLADAYRAVAALLTAGTPPAPPDPRDPRDPPPERD